MITPSAVGTYKICCVLKRDVSCFLHTPLPWRQRLTLSGACFGCGILCQYFSSWRCFDHARTVNGEVLPAFSCSKQCL